MPHGKSKTKKHCRRQPDGPSLPLCRFPGFPLDLFGGPGGGSRKNRLGTDHDHRQGILLRNGERLPDEQRRGSQGDGLLLLRVNGRGESRSLLLPAAVADGDNFSRSLGTRPDAEVKTFTALSDYLGFLHSALAGCRLPQLLPFVNRGWATATRVKKPFYRCTAAAIFIFCLYLGLAFFIPYSAEKGLKRENQALNARLSGLLQQRRQLDNLRRQQQQLAGTVNNYSSKIALFQLLAQALPPRTVIRQLNLSGNTVEISGLSPQASQLLSSLSQKPEISEARFSSPLREDRQSGMERFALMFRFSRKVE
ncbi:MAG: hypothetical protein BZ151_12420 [Desulfobacca sp. 4484_104]|nr:MAG: hypothetical protein BZ151_12420 [Desulfobacca sp. 4484_104]